MSTDPGSVSPQLSQEEPPQQMSLFGTGDHGDLTEEEVPEYEEDPGGLLITRDREQYR